MHEKLNLVSDLALILISAGVVTLIFKWFKQPLVLGYIVAGFLVGPHFNLFPTVIEIEFVSEWSEIGIIFLLFALGLEFSFKKLASVGNSAFVTAITEVITMFCVGFVAGYLLGWTTMECIFLGGMLSMSSTTIIIKAFSDLGLRNQKFTTIVFGTLIVEDLVGILLMVMVSTVAASHSFAGGELFLSLLKMGFFLVLMFLIGIYVLPSIFRKTRKIMNDETLLIISIGLCFGMVSLANYTGLSTALGAFIMGSILAETIESEHIEHLIKNIKDLFGAIFFVSVGMLVDPNILLQYWLPILVLTLLTIFGKAFFSSMGVLLSGQSLKTSLQSGFSLAQIGEFAFIIAALGYSLGVLRDFIYPVIVAISVITTFTTPYFIRLAEPFYNWLAPRLSPKITGYLDRYAAGSSTVTAESDWKKLLKYYTIHLVVYSVLIVAVILFFTHFINPLLREQLHFSNFIVNLICATATLIVMMPFVLGLITTSPNKQEIFKKLLRENRNNRGKLAVLLLIQVLFAVSFVMGVLFFTLQLSTWIIISITGGIFLVIILLRKHIKLYQVIQARFLFNFNQKEELKKKKNPIAASIKGGLSNRDIHFAKVEVSADSPFIGQKIKDLDLRRKYGVNIVCITRGSKDIYFPSADEYIYPSDHLVAIGTDEQISQFTNLMEIEMQAGDPTEKPQICLESFVVESSCSYLVGQNLAASNIRDSNCLIVGVDRNETSIMNPDMSFTFAENDIVWVAGEKQNIEKLVCMQVGCPKSNLEGK